MQMILYFNGNLIEPQRAAVGTNYSRVIPSREINSKDRDSFWKKQEEEERKRIEIERSKQLDAKLELDKVGICIQMEPKFSKWIR